jgi:hypothetical protein
MPAAIRSKWSWLYVWIVLWMASLTAPTIESWQSALARDGGAEPDPSSGWGIVIALALATVVLGFAIGWCRRWTTLWIAAALGALVLSVGVEVDYDHGWSGGEPLPVPAPFLMYFVILGVLLWTGAGLDAVALTARQHRSRPGRPAPWLDGAIVKKDGSRPRVQVDKGQLADGAGPIPGTIPRTDWRG